MIFQISAFYSFIILLSKNGFIKYLKIVNAPAVFG